MVAELELNSVIPPPDTDEEDKQIRKSLIPLIPAIHAKVNSKREITKFSPNFAKGQYEFSRLITTINHYSTLIARFQD